MTISASLVKELRERTGAGMMECKHALTETQGDIEAAIKSMREKGQAKADKKSSRVAAEGIMQVLLSDDHKRGIIVEVNCETDFVARDSNFIEFAEKIAAIGLKHKVKDINALNDLPYDGGPETVEQTRQQLVVKIGENVSVRRLHYIESTEELGSYLHGVKIGVLVQVMGGDQELRKDLAMHIAANNPQVISPEQVPQENIVNESEIFKAQAQSSGKPADIIEKMVAGRIKKYVDEVSLLGQPFVKKPEITIAKLLQEKGAKVVDFVRFGVGEGIEKQTTNFAEEVMAQLRD